MKILDVEEEDLMSVIKKTFPNNSKLAGSALRTQMETVQEFLNKTNILLNKIAGIDEWEHYNLGLTLIGMSLSNILVKLTPMNVTEANDFFKKIRETHSGLFSEDMMHQYSSPSQAVN